MKDDQTVSVTAGGIRAAASKCPDAKRVLEAMFPEVFKVEARKTVPLIEGWSSYIFPSDHPMHAVIQIMHGAGTPEERENGLYLATGSSEYEFELVSPNFLRVTRK